MSLEPLQWQDIPGKTCQILIGDGHEKLTRKHFARYGSQQR